MPRYIFIVADANRYYNVTGRIADDREAALQLARSEYERNGVNKKYNVVGVIEQDAAVNSGWSSTMSRSKFDAWVEVNLANLYTGETSIVAQATPAAPGPRKPTPVICPEVWATPRKGVDYMAAVRDMCKGVK